MQIRRVLELAGDRYRRIRVDLELLSGEHSAIVKHIKSYDNWEYFIEHFADDGCVCCFDMFNAVCVFKDGDMETVSLYYMPNHDRNDKNNVYFGTCGFDDVLNIEEIIRKNMEKCGKSAAV